jgi:Predicted integral membrane protein
MSGRLERSGTSTTLESATLSDPTRLNDRDTLATFGAVTAFLLAFDVVLAALKLLLFAGACVLFVVFAVDWLVRTRRINPFGPVARFFRRAVDPLIMPVEQRIVRAGGSPASAPWWTLVAVVVGGILLILALQFLRDLLVSTALSVSRGPRGLYDLLVSWTFSILQIALIVRIIASWFRLNPYGRWLRWSVSLTEWLLRPLRSVIPPFGMIDVTPIVAYFILVLLESFMRSIGTG